MRVRRGLSYLEVLIAAAIALTGILGAIAIYPVAARSMQDGVVADVASSVGPSAIEQVSTLGADKPKRWMFRDSSMPPQWVLIEDASNYNARSDLNGNQWHPSISSVESFIVDPRFVSSDPVHDPAKHDIGAFPYYDSAGATDPRVRRITLTNKLKGTAAGRMAMAHARLLFKCQDDLLMFKPDDEFTPAQQSLLTDTAGNVVRRDYYADYEFAVMLTPRQPFDGKYETTVVIYHQRGARLDEILEPTSAADTLVSEERLVDVLFLANGIGGGEVMIQNRAGRPASDLHVMPGQWVMLSAMMYTPPGVTNPPNTMTHAATGPRFEWYKVAAIGEVFQESGFNRRYLTLEGADWPVLPPDTSTNPATQRNLTPITTLGTLGSDPPATRMTLCNNIVSVYRDTTRRRPVEGFVPRRLPNGTLEQAPAGWQPD